MTRGISDCTLSTLPLGSLAVPAVPGGRSGAEDEGDCAEESVFASTVDKECEAVACELGI